MSRLMNAVRLFVLTACLAPLLAQAASGSSYRVSLGSLHGTDPAAVAKQLAAEYHGHLETPVDEQGTFLMTLSSATADLLRRDPRVSRLERQEVTASAAVAPNASTTWTLGDGNYQYDGSGNIKAIGSQVFVYDVENRLVSEGTTGAVATKQKYTYDGFGNILTYKDDDGITYTVGASVATNRASVTSSSAFHMSGTYDNSGNMTGRSDDLFRYDALNVMTKSFVDGQWRVFVYNVNDERVGTIVMTAETGGAETSSEWTIRDPGGQVLRRFAKEGGQYVWQQDYIYRDGKMLASEVTGQIATLHYHLDHLGSPRLITGNGGVQISRHTYYPFGKEVAAQQAVREDKKFTGHERDPIGLDYMHARYYDYRMGRFLSVDPVLDSVDPRRPQSWNRYAYSLNNPLTYLDPDGRTTVVFIVSSGSKMDEKGGHAAVWVESGNQRGGVSRGGYNIDKNGWNDFLAHYTGQGREVHAYILKTTDAQDQAMLDFFKQEGPGGGTDANKSVQTCGLTENCASGVVNVLQAGGVVPANSDPSAARGANAPFVLKNELDNGQLEPQVQRHIDFVPPPPPPKKEGWWSRLIDRIF